MSALFVLFQSTPLCKGRHPSCNPPTTEACFNPRPYVRGDIKQLFDKYHTGGFNPRPYVRGDRKLVAPTLATKRFNPRPYVRGDLEAVKAAGGYCWFQSTPLCKGRLLYNFNNFSSASFNPRPYVRGDIFLIFKTF